MEIELTRMFVKVVQNGSFSKAASILDLPKSTVSKAITRLEKETGTKLLLRTTRSQTLTAAGRAFYETCLVPIQTLEDAQKSLYGNDSIVSGSIRLTAPEDLGYAVIAPVIGSLSRRHPQLTFDLDYSNQIIDLVKDGFDLAVRIGKLSESSLKVKKLGHIILVPVASPNYIKATKKIRSPKDLQEHDCLALKTASLNRRWLLKSKNETIHVPVHSRVVSNQVTSLLKMAVAGGGVAYLPYYLCKAEIAAGGLVRVLPEFGGVGVPVSIVSPLSISSSARLKLVSDEIAAGIQSALAEE